MASIQETPRFVYRFENYKRALRLLSEAIETMHEREITQLEKEGIVQRFEYTWELAWKLLKDYLEHSGITLGTITPTTVIKAAFASKIIENGDIWMRALDARNKMSHTHRTSRIGVDDIGDSCAHLASSRLRALTPHHPSQFSNYFECTYDLRVFEQIISDIDRSYLKILDDMYMKMFELVVSEDVWIEMV